MSSTTYIHPNLVAFWSLLAYPKWLVKAALLLLILISIPAYLVSRPEMFVEQNATITGIEFSRGINTRDSDSLKINYQYIYKNKVLDSSDSHYLPWRYPDEKVGGYVANWRHIHPIDSVIKIKVNDWRPRYSSLSKLNEFKVGSGPSFWDFYIYFFVYYWLFPMTILIFISMTIKYFFMRDKNDE